jgi:hypothetical protein
MPVIFLNFLRDTLFNLFPFCSAFSFEENGYFIGDFQAEKYKLSSSFCKILLQLCGLKSDKVLWILSVIVTASSQLNKTLTISL